MDLSFNVEFPSRFEGEGESTIQLGLSESDVT